MRSIVLLAVGLAAAAMPILVLVVALIVVRRSPDPSQGAGAARRHAGVVHALAWVLAAVTPIVLTLTAPAVFSAGPSGLYAGLYAGVVVGLVPTAFGVPFLVTHAAGELTWPRPTGRVRRAALVRRTARDVAPPLLRRALWSWAAVLVVTLVASGLLADEGRHITRVFPGGSSTASPFPGWFYGLPLLAATALVLLAAEGVLQLVARRPAVMDAAPEWDSGLRRLSAHRVLRGAQLVLALTAAGVLSVAGSAVASAGSGGAVVDGVVQGSPGYTVVGVALTVLAGVVGLAGVALAAVPGTPAPPSVPAGQPLQPVGQRPDVAGDPVHGPGRPS